MWTETGTIVQIVGVLIDLPANASALQKLRGSLPLQWVAVQVGTFTSGGFIVVDVHSTIVGRWRRARLHINRSRDPSHTVGVRRSDNTLLVHITDSVAFCNGEVVRDFLPGEVTPGPRGVAHRPVVVLVAIQCGVIRRPAVGAAGIISAT